MTQAATLETVARVAGVSVTTASRVLNGSPRVPRPELCERVLAAAKALNYEPDANAQAIARGATAVLGLIVHDISDPYFASIAAGVMRAADSRRLMVSVTDTQGQLEREAAYMAAMRRQRARAVIMAGSRSNDPGAHTRLASEIEAFSAQGGRVTFIGQQAFGTDTVAIGNTSGAYDLAVTLASLGYRRFAVLAGPPLLRTAADRVAGFRDGLASRGLAIDPQDIVAGAFTRDGGYEAMTTLLPRASPGLCAFAVNDVMAVGAMAAVSDAGLAVPADIAIAGFDDIATLRDIRPGLTTVRLPLEEIGSIAVGLIDSPSDSPRVEHVSGKVIVRASTPATTVGLPGWPSGSAVSAGNPGRGRAARGPHATQPTPRRQMWKPLDSLKLCACCDPLRSRGESPRPALASEFPPQLADRRNPGRPRLLRRQAGPRATSG